VTLATSTTAAPRAPGSKWGGHNGAGCKHPKDYGPGRVCTTPGCGTILRRTHKGPVCDPCINNAKAQSRASACGSVASAAGKASTKAARPARAKKGGSVSQKDSGYALRLVKLRAWCADGTAKRLRLAAGLSLGDISREIGTDKATIMHWENGERRPQAAEYVGRYMSLLDRIASDNLHDDAPAKAAAAAHEDASDVVEESAKDAPAGPPAPAPVTTELDPEQPANDEAASESPCPQGPPPRGFTPFAGVDYELVVIGDVVRQIESLTGHETRRRAAAYIASRFL
jgi:transcriptional regulator with XRE-family HTH domain